MILIAGVPSEAPTRAVIDAAESAGVQYALFDQHQAHLYELSLSCLGNRISGRLSIQGVDYELNDFSGVFMRVMDHYALPERLPDSRRYAGKEAAYKSGIIHQFLLQWFDIAPCRVMNRPKDGLSNASKPFQAQIIAACGLKVPPTCITNDAAIAREFKQRWGSLIYKSISSARSIVQELDGPAMQQLNRVRYLPTQFQQRLQGVNIRVHVVGDVLFATKAETTVVDYRYSGREGSTTELSAVELPEKIREKCFAVSAALQLPLCGIDLFLNEDGDYYCFEANPAPGFTYFQEGAGQDIAGAIVRCLEYGTAG